MNRYTSFAFEMSIANELFQKQNKRQKQGDMTQFTQKEKDEQKSDQNNETFLSKNIFFYFKYTFFNFFKDKFKNSLNSDQMDYVKQCHEQMMKQLDIKRIIKRINCLQHCISNIIDSQRLQDLLLTQPSAVQQIKKNRLTFEIIQKESILTEREANQTSNCNQIMQDKICYQISATALAKDVDGTLTKQLGEILNTLEQKSQISVDQIQIKRKKQQKDIVRNQPKASITKQLIITESFNQRKKQPQQQEDIYEIPIQFCNFQSQ